MAAGNARNMRKEKRLWRFFLFFCLFLFRRFVMCQQAPGNTTTAASRQQLYVVLRTFRSILQALGRTVFILMGIGPCCLAAWLLPLPGQSAAPAVLAAAGPGAVKIHKYSWLLGIVRYLAILLLSTVVLYQQCTCSTCTVQHVGTLVTCAAFFLLPAKGCRCQPKYFIVFFGIVSHA